MIKINLLGFTITSQEPTPKTEPTGTESENDS